MSHFIASGDDNPRTWVEGIQKSNNEAKNFYERFGFIVEGEAKVQMIFAEMEYPEHYAVLHAELATFIRRNFSKMDAGLQGDSWISILDGEEKVQIDTFTSMKHQIKSSKAGPHVQKVIDLLLHAYTLRLYASPKLEAHEDGPTA